MTTKAAATQRFPLDHLLECSPRLRPRQGGVVGAGQPIVSAMIAQDELQ